MQKIMSFLLSPFRISLQKWTSDNSSPIFDTTSNFNNTNADNGPSSFYYLPVLFAIIVAICGTYYAWKYIFDYLTAKAFSITISSLNNNHNNNSICRVGETISLKISLFKIEENGNEVLCSRQQMEKIDKSISIQIEKEDNCKKNIAILRSNTQEHDGILIQFSIRESGLYKIIVKVGFFNFVGSPFTQEMYPGPMYPSRTILDVLNPKIICIVAEKWHQIRLNPQDRYGNPCHFEEGDCNKLQLTVKFGDSPIDSHEEIKYHFIQEEQNEIKLNIKITKCNLYTGELKFSGVPIQHSNFTIVCMNSKEDELVKDGFDGFFNQNPGPFQASLLSIGSKINDPNSLIWIYVNSRQIAISSLVIGFIHYPLITFRVTRRTQILFNGFNEIQRNRNENSLTLKISDGVQPSVIIALKAPDARLLLATFSFHQGQKLKNYTFTDKVQAMTSELPNFFSYFRKPTVVELDRTDLLGSTMNFVKNNQINWYNPFVITYKSTTGSGRSSNNTLGEFLSTDKWLNLMIQSIFGHDESGLFRKIGSSRLLHPTMSSCRSSCWEIQHYEFAGSILGKSVYEAHVNGLCVKMNQIRFTRSLLALLVGIPVKYKHFESDDPVFYQKYIKPILDSEENETNYTFTEIDEREGRVNINLIPNGSNIPVTKRNKEKYLNLLATHKFVSRYNEEIEAFRYGFYKVIPQGLLTDFDENELEKVLCSGSKGFDLEDLKKNCRVIGEIVDISGSFGTKLELKSEFPEIERHKIIKWLWIVIENMSDSEREQLLQMTTGHAVLPACGFKELNFKIAMMGNKDMPPTGHPSLHTLSVGNHSTFENFEKNMLIALHGDNNANNNDAATSGNSNESVQQSISNELSSTTM